jgi:monofunctional biosynthetic peptidoglycan transglycosylase
MTRARLTVAVAAGLLLVGIGALVVSGVTASLPDVSTLARRTPHRTALMRQRLAEARARGRPAPIDQRWVPYERISPLLRRAVLIAEDDAFFSHDGLDWGEIGASVRRNLAAGRVVRGGSTITQQLARNLYLGNKRTPMRKLKEIVLAVRLERALTKRRIFELYLNLIEWGDGIYGIDAAARRHFGSSAAGLDAREAALLAAVIINPRRYDPARPARRIERRARLILTRMWRRGLLSEADYRIATGQAPRPVVPLPPEAPSDSGFSAPEPTSPPTTGDTLPAFGDSLPQGPG